MSGAIHNLPPEAYVNAAVLGGVGGFSNDGSPIIVSRNKSNGTQNASGTSKLGVSYTLTTSLSVIYVPGDGLGIAEPFLLTRAEFTEANDTPLSLCFSASPRYGKVFFSISKDALSFSSEFDFSSAPLTGHGSVRRRLLFNNVDYSDQVGTYCTNDGTFTLSLPLDMIAWAYATRINYFAPIFADITQRLTKQLRPLIGNISPHEAFAVWWNPTVWSPGAKFAGTVIASFAIAGVFGFVAGYGAAVAGQELSQGLLWGLSSADAAGITAGVLGFPASPDPSSGGGQPGTPASTGSPGRTSGSAPPKKKDEVKGGDNG